MTELEDPRPFLNGAEVVLTTGVRLKTGAAHAKDVGLLTGDDDLSGLYDLAPLNALLKADGEAEVSAG